MAKAARRLALGCVLLFFGMGSALAQGSEDRACVIKKRITGGNTDPHYLAHVYDDGTSTWKLEDVTTFNLNCIWYTGPQFNHAGLNHNYYFYDGANYRFLAAPFAPEGELYLSASVPETYILSNTDMDYYFYDWDGYDCGKGIARGHENPLNGYWTVYWVAYDLGNTDKWNLSTESYGITDNSARSSYVTITGNAATITNEIGGLSPLAALAEMEWSTSPFAEQGLSATVENYSYDFTPAYDTYEFDEVTTEAVVVNHVVVTLEVLGHHTYYFIGNTQIDPATIVVPNGPLDATACTYLWEITNDPDHYLSFSDASTETSSTSPSPTLYYINQNTTGHKTVTVKLTVTYSNGATQTSSTQVLVKTPCQNPGKSAEPTVVYDDVTVYWYATASDYKVSWQKDASGAPWSSATVGDITSYTITGLEPEQAYKYKVSAICGGVEQTGAAEYSFTTKKASKAMIYGAVFGGGRMADVTETTTVVIINTDSIGAVYGGNDIAGEVQGAEGSTIVLGVNAGDTYSTTYNNSLVSNSVRVRDVYGGGNGYYAYNGSSFVDAATTGAGTVPANTSVMAQSPTGEWNIPVWTNNSASPVAKTIPTIVKANITVTNNAVRVDSIFGGAKNAFLTATSDDVSITIGGGAVYAVFGGNNYGGALGTGSQERIVVNNTKTKVAQGYSDDFGRKFGIRYIFGGGNKVGGQNTYITVNGGMMDTIFGGGNHADVLSAHVTVNCPIGAASGDSIFGSIYTHAINSYTGGVVSVKDGYAWNGTDIYNVHTLFGGNNQANMTGLPVITLTSGSVGTVYGGGNAGDMKADVSGTFVYDGSDTKSIKYGTKVEMTNETMLVDYLYGGCQMSNVDYSTWVEIQKGHVGHVFGGCNISGDVGSKCVNPSASSPSLEYQEVKGATYVKATGGTVYGDLFAGSNGRYHCNDGIYYISGINFDNLDTEGRYVGLPIPTHNETNVVVSENKTAIPATAALVKGNVYAGGNMAPVGFTDYSRETNPYPEFVGYASVRMYGGEVKGSMFGGGNMASIFGSNEIMVSGGTIGGALYGGNDFAGQVAQMSNRVLPTGSDMASDGITSLKKLGVHTYVKVTGKPKINTVYGGGNGAYDYDHIDCCDKTDQPIQTNTFVDININADGGSSSGGHINNVFGGGNGVTVTGGITVLLNVLNYVAGTTTDYDHVDNIFGGNNMGNLAILPDIIMLKGKVNTVYGGCNEGAMIGDFTLDRPYGTYEHISSRVRLDNLYTPVGSSTSYPAVGVVSGRVFGGCRMNGVTNMSIVFVEGSNHPNAEIFGGCDISGTVAESRVVVTGGTVKDVFGGGDGEYDYRLIHGAYGDYYEVWTIGLSPEKLIDSLAISAGLPKSVVSRVDLLSSTTGTTGTVTGNVYGGADAADCGETYMHCDCGTVTGNVFGGNNKSGTIDGNVTVDIYGGVLYKVFGGCNEGGDIKGQITVNVEHTATCAKSLDYVFGGGYIAPFAPTAVTANPQVNIKRGTVNKAVFGAGEGVGAKVTADPEVNIGGFGYDVVVGSSVSEIENFGEVFGGGDLARVEGNPVVNINAKSTIGSTAYPFDLNSGCVYGGGQGSSSGDETIAVVKGDPVVNINDGLIYNKVFGGGKLGNVDGKATVNVIGGTVGSAILDNTKPGFDPEYNYAPGDYPTYWKTGVTAGVINEIGCVFGGGEGVFIADNPSEMDKRGKVKCTEVNVSGGFIHNNVYGGGDLGKVEGSSGATFSTDVNIIGGIVQRRAFAGGRGVISNPDMQYVNIGIVDGDARIQLSGTGEVQVSLYGGAETAHVGGNSNVILTGGVVGHNRTLAQITAHPGHCNVYGAGMGDPAEGNYNLWTNVNNAIVDISGTTRIYGSVFGGGNDGHVLNNITLDFHLTSGQLGTYGYSGNDGNIFCGGRGYNAVAPTAGGVGGDITAHVYGAGTILGNVYGGGRIASTGIYFSAYVPAVTDPSTSSPGTAGVPNLSKGTVTLTVDGDVVIGHEYKSTSESGDGNEYLVGQVGGNIFGGAKGVDMNPTEYNPCPETPGVYKPNATEQATMGKVNKTVVTVGGNVKVRGSVYGGGEMGRVMKDASVSIGGSAVIGETRHDGSGNPLPEADIEKLVYSGNVYGGGWGSSSAYKALQGDTLSGYVVPFDYTTRKDVGRVMGNTTITVTDGQIYSNIYGGGAYASVGSFDGSGDPESNTGKATVTMSDGQVGPMDITPGHNACVFGGGKGMSKWECRNFGQVFETDVEVKDQAKVWGSIFGGGEDGAVVGDTKTTIKLKNDLSYNLGTNGKTSWDGNVFGGGRNYSATIDPTDREVIGRVGGNVTVNVLGGHILGSVFGGGRIGSVGVNDGRYNDDPSLNTFEMQGGIEHGCIVVNIGGTGQTDNVDIGHPAAAHERVGGNVYGGGKGAPGPTSSAYPRLAQVKETTVNIGEASGHETWIEGSVFGSGEDGHVLHDTHINMTAGQVGGTDYSVTPVECADEFHGNVYGAGRGLDTYEDGAGNQQYSPTAGIVGHNTYVNITGGCVLRCVYGGGNLASGGTDGATDTGLATVTIGGTAKIGTGIGNFGHVFGAGKGMAGALYSNLSKVYETFVTIEGNAQIYGSVFGGGEDGHVVKHSSKAANSGKGTATLTTKGDTHVVIRGSAKIGVENDTDASKKYHGNVYGGGRGIDKDPVTNQYSRTAGKVAGNTHVNILSGDVYQYVYGGGDQSIVDGRKIVNIYGGWVHEDVYGGSNEIPFNVRWSNPGLKTVNMFGGEVLNLFGCSRNTIDGDFQLWDGGDEVVVNEAGELVYKVGGATYTGTDEALTLTAKNSDPTSFVNVSGGYLYALGEEMGSVHAAGMAGVVYGSTIINIGKDAIYNAPYSKPADNKNIDKDDLYSENTLLDLGLSLSNPPHVAHKLQVSGSVFGGSNYFKAESTDVDFTNFNVQGYSNIYIDGKDYDMGAYSGNYNSWVADATYMVIDGNIYGSGTHCESGHLGRNIIVRNYGNRINRGDVPSEFPGLPPVDDDPYEERKWFVRSTRPLGTIQRCGSLVIDNSNFAFTGMKNLADGTDTRLYAVFKVDSCFYVVNGSGVTLGLEDVADMDSIHAMRSGAFKTGHNVYENQFPVKLMNDTYWHWVGIRDKSAEANKLYYEDGDENNFSGELAKTAENVMVFKDDAKLYIRYTTLTGKTKYGELQGFFRMIADAYIPWSEESFAHARVKLTTKNTAGYSGTGENTSDGGFMSYTRHHNFYINGESDYDDGGAVHTRRNQYPYTNVVSFSKDGDTEEYRVWLIPDFKGSRWYVDGRGSGGIGHDYNEGANPKWGLYPDMPKKSLSGTNGVFAGTYTDASTHKDFQWYDDIVYYTVDIHENPSDPSSPIIHHKGDVNEAASHFKDIIYVVGEIDADLEAPIVQAPAGDHADEPIILYRYPGKHVLSSGGATDPGPNYGAMINMKDKTRTFKNVHIDGLYGHVGIDESFMEIDPSFNDKNVNSPMIVTQAGANLTLTGTKTILKRGYNKNEATYYISSNPVTYSSNFPGGGIFLQSGATLNLEDKAVILGNWQKASVDHYINLHVDFSKQEYTNGQEVASLTADDVTIAFAQGSGVSKPSYSIGNAAMMCVSGNTITVSSTTSLKKRILFSFGGSDNPATPITASTGTMSGSEWTASPGVTSVTFTIGGSGSSRSVKILDILTQNSEAVRSNVFLPTFEAHVKINNELAADARIGITSPVRNEGADYTYNTFSPVATAIRSGYETADAQKAWESDNFSDDLQRFFGSGIVGLGGSHTTFYKSSIPDYPSPNPFGLAPANTLFFGWTWNNVVTSEPTTGYSVSGDEITISSREGLAWLISLVNGLNDQVKTSLYGKTIRLTTDLLYNASSALDHSLIRYVWLPIGQEKTTTEKFAGTFDGQGHLIEGLRIAYLGRADIKYEFSNYGLFGWTDGATINRTFLVDAQIKPNNESNVGGIVGVMGGNSTLSNSEAQVKIVCDVQTDNNALGGLVGFLSQGEIHSSMAIADIEANKGSIGGLVGAARDPQGYAYSSSVNNSFAYPKFTFAPAASVKVGGLIGDDVYAKLTNSYSRLQSGCSGLTQTNYGSIIHTNNDNVVQNCFGQRDLDGSSNPYPLCVTEGSNFSNNSYFTAINSAVLSSDHYGYLYADNYLCDATGAKTDTAMFVKLNEYIETATPNGYGGNKKYARWARPTLSEINGDYPLLMLCNYDGSGNEGQGDFRSVATYGSNGFLQYGGVVRDGTSNTPNYTSPQLDGALTRATDGNSVFVYGDITVAPTVAVSATKVAIHEDAAITAPGTLASFSNTYVGVTFDNPSRSALDAYGNVLHRDWHMFSTPLSNAPLGINYNGQNVNNNAYKYDPWDGTDELPVYNFFASGTSDGYFPSSAGSYIPPSGEKYAYPYDFFTWYEPCWQWINFKRNGPSHWHYDPFPVVPEHPHIEYKAYFGVGSNPDADENVNESELVPGKGYMMAIQDNTYMQSHGQLNTADVSIKITQSTNSHGSSLPVSQGFFGNNFVGNPYHAYLDADKFFNDNKTNPDPDKNIKSYYVYDAYISAEQNIKYLIYPYDGSSSGYYGSKYLHPHQGFFVKMPDESATKDLTFSLSQCVTRSTAHTQPFRDKPAYRLVNLFAYDADGRGDVVVIEFDRPENGGGEKAKALRNGKHLIYAHHDETDYGAFFAKEGTKKVPVRFWSFEDRSKVYTLRWELKNGDFPRLYLIDNLLGTVCDMTVNNSYEFEASKNDYLSRFYIVFELENPEEPEEPEEPETPANGTTFAFFDGDDWVIDGKGPLALVDMTGRILYATELSGENNRINFDRFARGVYVLRLVEGKTVKTQKIILR